jgi:hypothetical protein
MSATANGQPHCPLNPLPDADRIPDALAGAVVCVWWIPRSPVVIPSPLDCSPVGDDVEAIHFGGSTNTASNAASRDDCATREIVSEASNAIAPRRKCPQDRGDLSTEPRTKCGSCRRDGTGYVWSLSTSPPASTSAEVHAAKARATRRMMDRPVRSWSRHPRSGRWCRSRSRTPWLDREVQTAMRMKTSYPRRDHT